MKKRYAILLTVENYERFLVLAEKLGMPRVTIHSIIDDSFGAVIDSMEKSLETFQTKGKLTMADMFTHIGQQLSQMEEKEVKQNETRPVPERPARIVKKRKEKKTE